MYAFAFASRCWAARSAMICDSASSYENDRLHIEIILVDSSIRSPLLSSPCVAYLNQILIPRVSFLPEE